MKDLSVSKFKAHMAAYLRDVQQGRTLVITEHRRPIAEVRPHSAADQLIEPAPDSFSPSGARISAPHAGLAMKLIDEDRDGRG